MIQNVVGSQHRVAHCNRVGPPAEVQRYHPGMFSVQDESGTPAGYKSSTPKRDVSCAAYGARPTLWHTSWLTVGHGWNSVWGCYHLVWVSFQALLAFLAHMKVYKASDNALREDD
jgi:hypothetical protein